jgi:hypothetical protein
MTLARTPLTPLLLLPPAATATAAIAATVIAAALATFPSSLTPAPWYTQWMTRPATCTSRLKIQQLLALLPPLLPALLPLLPPSGNLPIRPYTGTQLHSE